VVEPRRPGPLTGTTAAGTAEADGRQTLTSAGHPRPINLRNLNQEAAEAGNADIDLVSGATYTSDGYAQSLQSALDKAGLS
jgi:major membrane immunogen (membrane-anchored lipoprotein)